MSDGRVSHRRLAAVLAADVVGYSALVAADEDGTLRRLRALFREAVQPAVAAERGRIFKLMGDAFLAEFPSAEGAVRCASALQAQVAAREAADLRLRIGVHLGDVVVEGSDLLGDGVNVAARLEGVATPGGIVVSGAVAEALRGRVPLEDLGEQALKNLGRAVRVFRVATGGAVHRPAPALPDRPSLVVLPFQNMSGDAEQDYFADGMVEDITTALSRIRWLFVIARNSAFTYKGRAVDVRQVGRELGVRYVLEGSVRRAGGRLRITGQLVEAETGHHVWADRFDGALDDVFELQDRVAAAVAGAIEPSLRQAEMQRAHGKPTGSLGAYDLFLRALARHYVETREASDDVLALLRQAIALDADYAAAKAFLAHCTMLRFIYRWASAGEVDEAVSAARDALAARTDDPEVLRWCGQALAVLSGDDEVAIAATRAAVERNPNSATVHAGAGWVCNHVGEAEAARQHFLTVLRLSPLDPNIGRYRSGLAQAHLLLGDFAAAADEARAAIADMPVWPLGHRNLAVALAALGHIDEARTAAQRLLQITPRYRLADERTQRVLRRRRPDLADIIERNALAAGIPP